MAEIVIEIQYVVMSSKRGLAHAAALQTTRSLHSCSLCGTRIKLLRQTPCSLLGRVRPGASTGQGQHCAAPCLGRSDCCLLKYHNALPSIRQMATNQEAQLTGCNGWLQGDSPALSLPGANEAGSRCSGMCKHSQSRAAANPSAAPRASAAEPASSSEHPSCPRDAPRAARAPGALGSLQSAG